MVQHAAHEYPAEMPRIPTVTDVEAAFGSAKYLPTGAEVPAHIANSPAEQFISLCFFGGMKAACQKYELHSRYPMEQEQGDAVMKLIGANLRSFEPKHEAKEAGCATLLDRWFKVVAL